MKTLVVVVLGAADRPLEDLGGRTPLEAATTPVLDRLARDGRVGRLGCAPKDVRAEEGAFVLSLFGLDPLSYADVGAALDAAALGVEVQPADRVFRLALVTADDTTVYDPGAGGIGAEEARLLLASLQEALGDGPLTCHAGDDTHLLRHARARDLGVRTVPPYEAVGKRLQAARPRGRGAAALAEAMACSVEVFARHEVNELRRELGENPATQVWPWASGVHVPLPDFTARTGVRAAVIGRDGALRGAASLQGVACPPRPAGEAQTDLRADARAALQALEEHDLVFLHVGVCAQASHRRDVVAKVAGLERIDGYVLGALARALEGGLEARFAVLGGPAVSAETGRYLSDPVPFLVHGGGVRGHRRGVFTEVGARDGRFEVERGHELLGFLLHLPS